MEEQHVHTVYEAKGGGYICSGCEKRFVDPSPPSLHIGMGDASIKERASERYPVKAVSALTRWTRITQRQSWTEGALFANAHTKSVSIEELHRLVMSAYDETRGVGNQHYAFKNLLRNRLLKLTQQP